MRYDRAVILTDLDGTLFSSSGQVSADDRAAIQEFIDGGGLFAVATGREPHNARMHLPGVPLNGPSIVLNGAAVYDFVRERFVYTILMDKEAAADILRFCQRSDLPLDQQVYHGGHYIRQPLETADPGFLRNPSAHRLCAPWIGCWRRSGSRSCAGTCSPLTTTAPSPL